MGFIKKIYDRYFALETIDIDEEKIEKLEVEEERTKDLSEKRIYRPFLIKDDISEKEIDVLTEEADTFNEEDKFTEFERDYHKRMKRSVLLLLLGFILGFTFFLSLFFLYYPRLMENTIRHNFSKIVTEQSVEKGKEEKKYKIDWNTLQLKTEAIYGLLNDRYLEEIDEEKMEDAIYKGIVSSTGDPYSVYYNKEEYKQFNESTSGTYYGIGVVVSQNPETKAIKVVKTFKKGSSYKAGILADDILIKVDGKSIEGEELSKVVTKIKGKEGTFVKVTVLRGKKEIDFDLKRTKLEVETIFHEMMEEKGKKIGYISISEFDEVTLKQFREALDELDKKGMQGLMIDLRDNPGGRLDIVVEMLDRMLPKGLLVYTVDKKGEKIEEFSDDKESFSKPLVVLINENSASASEIFAGAMQDYKKATLVGEKSFGKGIVQSIVGLGDGTAVKYTVSKYFTPNGRSIHGIGIEPDVKEKLDKTKFKDGKYEKEKDSQLEKAKEVLIDKLDKQ